MATIPQQFPPINWQDFQRLTLRVLQKLWDCPGLEIFARPGENQYGVDILDLSGKTPLRGAQCKRYEPSEALAPSEIRAEVQKAKAFPTSLDLYAIVTSAKKSGNSQLAVLEINREHSERRLFKVVLITWDDINDFLNENSEIAGQFYGGVGEETVARIERKLNDVIESARASSQTPPSPTSGGRCDAEIDEAKRYLEEHEYRFARLLLQRIRDRYWDQLSPRQKFRVLSNLAVARLEEGAIDEAARLFLEAKELQPDDRLALENELLAYQLLGDEDDALRLSSELRNRFPTSGRAWAVWVQHTPEDPDAIQRQIPASVFKDPEVSLAMARRLTMAQANEKAEVFAKQATDGLPNRSYAWWLLAQTILGAYAMPKTIGSQVGGKEAQTARLKQATEYFEKAAKLAQEEKHEQLRALALLGKSFASSILANNADAERSVEAAYECSPDEPAVLVSYAQVKRTRGDLPAAIELLRRANAIGAGEEGVFLLAESLAKRSTASDLDEALGLIKSVIANPGQLQRGLREHALITGLSVLKALGRLSESDALLSSVPQGTVSALATEAIGARLAMLRGNLDEAHQRAERAVAVITSETSTDEVRLVANLLRDMGLDREALALWQKLSDKRMGYDTQELINCAGRLRRDDVLLDTCKGLREQGVEDDQLLRLEIDLLQRYDAEAAIAAIQQYVQKHPEDLSVRLRLSVIGLQSGRPEVVSAEPSSMPPASDVRPEEAVAAVWVLRSTSHANEAVRYAYQVLRLHFDDAEAHRAYVNAMIATGPQPNISEPAAAGPGTAVNFVEEGTTTEQWVVIEEEHPPDGKLGEISPDSSLANELKGKRPGDSFTLSKPRFAGAGRTATLKIVQSKFVYRYQDCLAQLEVRFPDVAQVQMVRLRATSGPGGTPETDFGPIIDALKKKRERIADLEKIYASELCPIHLLAEAMGLNDLQVLAGLANNPDFEIRCCSGSAPERDDALKDLTGAKEILIDLTAIATLTFLDLTQLLRDFPIQLAVSPATLAELRRMASETRDSVNAKTGLLGLVGERPNFVSYSEDFKREEVEALDDLMVMLSKKCNVPSCEKLASLDPIERDEIVRLFGQNGAESIVLASEPGRILWSDDQVLAEFAKTRYAVKRVWTQILLRSRMSSGALQPSTFFEATAKLAGWGYFFTSVNPRSMIKGAELAKWNPTAWPIAGSLRYVSLDSVPVPEVTRLTVLFITGLYREDILPEQRTALVVAMLESLAKRTGGVDLIRSMVGLLPGAFGLNAVRAAEAIRVFEAWLRGPTLIR